jgi:hypothetical protein
MQIQSSTLNLHETGGPSLRRPANAGGSVNRLSKNSSPALYCASRVCIINQKFHSSRVLCLQASLMALSGATLDERGSLTIDGPAGAEWRTAPAGDFPGLLGRWPRVPERFPRLSEGFPLGARCGDPGAGDWPRRADGPGGGAGGLRLGEFRFPLGAGDWRRGADRRGAGETHWEPGENHWTAALNGVGSILLGGPQG